MGLQKYLQNLIPSKPMLAAIVAVTLIGISPIFVKITDIGPNATGFYRMFFSLGFLVTWSAMTDKHHSYEQLSFGRSLVLAVLSGLFFSLDLACWHVALHHTEVVTASLFTNMMPVFMPLLIWVVYSQAPDWRFMIAVGIAILGAAIVTGEGFTLDHSSLKGNILAILAAFFYACYILVVSKLRKFMPVAKVMTWTTFFCSLFMLLFSILADEKIIPSTLNDWIGILALAFLVQSGGQVLLTYAMGYLSEQMISLLVLLSTFVSGIAGWLVFNEAISLIQFTGAVIVIGAIIYANYIETLTQKKYKHETKP